ncbi:MAG: group 1 truncated hemoglobin [Sumerlaeia bacterium]
MNEQKLYELLGGEPAIQKAVEVFYRKMLTDKRVSVFFERIDMAGQMAKQKAFLTMVTGGPAHYTGKSMREGHKHLVDRGLNDEHFDITVGYLADTLRELGVEEAHVAQVVTTCEGARGDVLNR